MGMSSFLNYEKPILCAMIQCPTPDGCIEKIRASHAEGAEAFGVQLCKLEKNYRTFDELKRIFDACEGKPIYVTSYRYAESADLSDDECADLLLLALDAGATLCDIMGDMFCKTPFLELTENEDAIKKQKALIEEIHARGGEVLMSCHTNQSTTLEQNLYIARSQAERGADIIKIVSCAEGATEMPVYIDSIQKIIAETGKKLLFLLCGAGEVIRYIGAEFGVCMYLCVAYHGPIDTPEQPTLERARAVRDNIVLRSGRFGIFGE